VVSIKLVRMDRAITASDASQRFLELLDAVSDGESFTITICGRPVARMLPADRKGDERSVKRLLEFVLALPVRHAGDWSRAGHYE
jgi:prevent-host-death family protein